MWVFYTLIGIFASAPYAMRRMEQRHFTKEGPYPSGWTMRQKELGSHMRSEALERDYWATKRDRLDVDIWAPLRKGDIDADRLKTPIWGNPARREHILSERWSRPVYGGGAGTGTAKWEDDSSTMWEPNTDKDKTHALRT